MSTVHAFPVPTMVWYDWATVFTGLGIGVGSLFQILMWSVPESKRHKVYTWTNFWLLLSGVIHVKYLFVGICCDFLLMNLVLFLFTCCCADRFGLNSISSFFVVIPRLNRGWICTLQRVS
jgi:hypothetical protein